MSLHHAVARGTLAAALLALTASSTNAHTIVGDRVFPVTLAIDDPGVNDELALPTFAYAAAANPDGSAGPITYSLGWDYSKTITKDLAISIGSEGVIFQKNPRATGVANIDVQLKNVMFQSAEHEFIIAAAVATNIGHTGSPPDAAIPAAPFSTIIMKGYAGKGFGDAPVDWLRPFAVTGEVDYAIPTIGDNPDMSFNPSVLTYGASLQYSLLYKNAYVSEVPDLLKRLVPAFEVVLNTPVANTGPGMPGIPVHVTAGVVGPSLYYVGQQFEIGVMAQFPVNQTSGKHVGAMAILDIFLDDVAPKTLGKPLFGEARASRASY